MIISRSHALMTQNIIVINAFFARIPTEKNKPPCNLLHDLTLFLFVFSIFDAEIRMTPAVKSLV